jgi:hypothetical protein
MSRYVALPKAVALAVPMARPKPAFKASAPACKVTTGDYFELTPARPPALPRTSTPMGSPVSASRWWIEGAQRAGLRWAPPGRRRPPIARPSWVLSSHQERCRRTSRARGLCPPARYQQRNRGRLQRISGWSFPGSWEPLPRWLIMAFPLQWPGIGIILALRLAMIQSEPAMTRKTISTPKARARILFVLSGPLPRCRKKTR